MHPKKQINFKAAQAAVRLTLQFNRHEWTVDGVVFGIARHKVEGWTAYAGEIASRRVDGPTAAGFLRDALTDGLSVKSTGKVA